jgi:hypothetical protein
MKRKRHDEYAILPSKEIAIDRIKITAMALLKIRPSPTTRANLIARGIRTLPLSEDDA